MRNKEKVIKELDSFVKSDNKNCMIVGTDVQNKHFQIIKYLNNLGKNLRILIRIDSMQNCEYILGSKFTTGVVKKVGNLNIYVDSMSSTSQNNTPQKFNCILVYPIASLKGINDNNIIDILNYRESEKIFWISNHDYMDYTYLKQICEIDNEIIVDSSDDKLHDRILEHSNNNYIENDKFEKLLVDRLSYSSIEEVINKRFNFGVIHTSDIGHKLELGSFGEYIFGGRKKSKRYLIKVLKEKENDRYVLLIKESKSK